MNSDGDVRFKWTGAGRSLTGTNTIKSLSPEEELKERTTKEGKKHVELPCKRVFSIKLDKHKVRIVACGNKTHEIYGRISTSDLDVAMLSFCSLGVPPLLTIASLHWIYLFFSSATLPEGRWRY